MPFESTFPRHAVKPIRKNAMASIHRVSGDRTRWRIADFPKSINTLRRTNYLPTFNVEQNFRIINRVALALFVFERPLFLGAIDLPQIVDAGVLWARGFAAAPDAKTWNEQRGCQSGCNANQDPKRESHCVSSLLDRGMRKKSRAIYAISSKGI
jgi:hypothetical protein